jgi:ABC-type phosphate/phosphonate transport system ATPase subunit
MAGGPKNGLKDVTLAIRKGELVGLLGGMASGKSTLVIINNFLQFLNFK